MCFKLNKQNGLDTEYISYLIQNVQLPFANVTPNSGLWTKSYIAKWHYLTSYHMQ